MAFLYVFKFFKLGFKPTASVARHIHFACTDINQLFHTIKGQSSKKKKKKNWRIKLEIAITCTIPVYLNEEMYTVFWQLPVSNKCPDHSVLWGKSWPNAVKGQGRYEAFLASGFLKMWSFFFCVIYLYIIKATRHTYQDYAKKSVCMFTIAMETPTNKVKMPFFTFFFILLLFSKRLLKVSIPHHTRTNTKLLLYVKPHMLLIYEKFCVGPWVVRYLNNHLKFRKW